jgi:NodT family efflux transporter outer membrane factor (OMF) lipoprotein
MNTLPDRPPLLLPLVAIALSACASTARFERPAAPSAAHFGAEDAAPFGEQAVVTATPSAEWWRSFGSPDIDAMVQRALAANPSVAAAAASLSSAEALAAARAGGRLPSVELAAGTGRQKYGAQFLGPLEKPPPFTYFSVGPTVSYTFDFAGGTGQAIERELALAEFQAHQLGAARLAVSGNVVLRAIEIASLETQLAATEELLQRDRETLRLVQTAYAVGSVSRLDVTSAESQLAADLTLVPPLRESLGQARNALALVLGETPSESALPSFELSRVTLPRELPLSVPSEFARRRPDILAAEAQLHAATSAVGVAQANLYPRLTLTASGSQQSIAAGALFDAASRAWGLTAGLVAPLFDGGTLRAEKRAATAELQVAEAHYRETVLAAIGQVADVLQSLQQDAAQLEAQAAAQASARETAELTRRAYEEGEIGVLQVLDAERRYQQARLGYVRALAERYRDSAQFFLAVGAPV